MNVQPTPWELHCPQCSHAQPCGELEMLEQLRRLGMLKRAQKPAEEMVVELLSAAAHRLACSACQSVGLALRESNEPQWPGAQSCESCGQAISLERLEVLPATTQCSHCAQSPAADDEAADYCPKCGAVMALRLASGRGLTRYRLSCPACR